jgi:hypothetical protein
MLLENSLLQSLIVHSEARDLAREVLDSHAVLRSLEVSSWPPRAVPCAFPGTEDKLACIYARDASNQADPRQTLETLSCLKVFVG